MNMEQTEKQTTPSQTSVELKALTEALAAPFDAKSVRFKPGKVSGNRAMALAYVDARSIQDRLDAVLGVLGWQDEYECLPDGTVVCRLRLKFGAEWITKMDVGAPSEQPDEGDRRKAAFSDALKRAAVKFGIGRYLYRLPSQWVDYDPQKRQFVKMPTLPPNMLPLPSPAAAKTEKRPVKPTVPPAGEGRETVLAHPEQAKTTIQQPAPKEAAGVGGKHGSALPANGVELQQRLYAYDAQLARQGVSRAGELVKHVVQAGVKAGYDADLATWTGPAISLAVEETRAFENRMRQQMTRQKEVA
jgi:Rad52/22 family double-strand break repair protein